MPREKAWILDELPVYRTCPVGSSYYLFQGRLIARIQVQSTAEVISHDLENVVSFKSCDTM